MRNLRILRNLTPVEHPEREFGVRNLRNISNPSQLKK